MTKRQTSHSSNRRTEAKRVEALRGLTQRELEILALVARGRPSSEIAVELEISLATVKRHLANIYRKLGAANRVQASNLYNFGDPHGPASPPGAR